MQIRFLGKDSRPGDSPTLYATDRETYLVQGYKISDAEILARLDMAEDETCVEITPRLLDYLAKDGVTGTVAFHVPPIMDVTAGGNYVIQGKRVVNGEALGHMIIPSHEDCVEVAKTDLIALLEDNDRGADQQ